MKIKADIINAFFPARCSVCDKVLYKGEYICKSCTQLLVHPADKKRRCDICFMPLCDCVCGKRLFFEKLSFSFFNEGLPKKAVFKLKFRRRLDLAAPFAKHMASSLTEREMLKQADIITFIPMTAISKFKRGYNQAQLLAEELSRITGKECAQLLYKCGGGTAQHSLNHLFRSGNPLGLYEPLPDTLDKFKGKTVLITDDIVTSGCTLNEAAKTLLIFGADKVFCASALATKKKKAKKTD